MTGFEFATAARVVFGPGRVREIAGIARSLGRTALVVTGRSSRRADAVMRLLDEAGVAASTLAVAGEPTIDAVVSGAAAARAARVDLIVGVGGGSAIDSAKAIAALTTNTADVFDYLEVIGRAEPLARASLPVIAVPTTAGTGSEVTRNAVLSSPRHRVKVSLRSVTMLPRAAVVDPDLTHDLPRDTTLATGLDALTQLIEPYVSARANPMVDLLCLEGMRRASRALPRVWADGHDVEARSDMALASLWSGMALANAGLGAVHGLAGPLGGLVDAAPHGAVCAALLPHVMAANIEAAGRAGDRRTLDRYDAVARVLTGREGATSADGTVWVLEFARGAGVPGLAAHGVTRDHFADIVEGAARASSMKANPVALPPEILTGILEQAL